VNKAIQSGYLVTSNVRNEMPVHYLLNLSGTFGWWKNIKHAVLTDIREASNASDAMSLRTLL